MILTRKLIAPTVVLIIVLLAGLFAYFFTSLHDVYHEAEEGALASFSDSFSAEIANQKELALALASEVAGNPAIQEAFSEKDKQSLIALAVPSYELLKESNENIILYQYHLPDGALFLNVNDPEVSAASDVTLSPAVRLANERQTPVAGLEPEKGKLGIRGVVPVYFGGEHIGSVEFGIGFNESLLASLKEKYGGEWQILLFKDRVPDLPAAGTGPHTNLMMLAATHDLALFNDPESYVKALNGEPTITHPSISGRDYAILSTPIYDYSEQIIGVLDIVYDHTHISAAQNRRLLYAGLASLAALVGGILALILLTRRTLQPIQTLTQVAAEIAENNISPYVNIKAENDEIGILVNAFNHMTVQLRRSIGELERRVADRTRDLEYQTLRLRVAAEVARDIASARKLDELLGRSAQMLLERFRFYHVGIFILDKSREFAILAASPTETGQRMIADHYRMRIGDTGLIGRVATTGEPRITLFAESDTVPLEEYLLPNTRSQLALPLKVEGNVIGVLDIQSDQLQAFNQDDIAILQIVTDQLATAIERTRLMQEVERNLSDLERAYGRYTREGWQRFGTSRQMNRLGYRFDNVRIEPVSELPDSGNQALASGTVVRSNGEEAGSAIAIPIKLRGQTIGVVNTKVKEGFAQTTLATIESALERLAAALESARLYEEASLRADREQAISQVTSAISSSTGYEEILRTVVMEVGAMLTDTEVSIQILRDSDDPKTDS